MLAGQLLRRCQIVVAPLVCSPVPVSFKTQTRRRFGGRHPLWGTGVMSWIEAIRKPHALSARTDDSRPGPATDPDLQVLDAALERGTPAASAATWAAKGVDLRDPLKPAPPLLAHDRALP